MKYLNINDINLERLNFKTNNISYQSKGSVVTLRLYNNCLVVGVSFLAFNPSSILLFYFCDFYVFIFTNQLKQNQ